MSADEDDLARSPWWYSGDDDVVPADSGPISAKAPSHEPPEPEPDDESSNSGMDWSMLMMGAAKMVDWATERVMAPHAEHEDPAEHPQCVVCRTIVLVGENGGLGSSQGRPSTEAAWGVDDIDVHPASDGLGTIRWIPILDRPPAS